MFLISMDFTWLNTGLIIIIIKNKNVPQSKKWKTTKVQTNFISWMSGIAKVFAGYSKVLQLFILQLHHFSRHQLLTTSS